MNTQKHFNRDWQGNPELLARKKLMETGEGLRGVSWSEYWKVIAQRDELLAAARDASGKLEADHFNYTANEWDDDDAAAITGRLDAAIAKAEGRTQ